MNCNDYTFYFRRKSNESEPLQRWYYDSSEGTCQQFDYLGRKGNGNRFLTRQSCEENCQPSQDPCELPKAAGPCDSRNERYWYDKEKAECFTFNWGEYCHCIQLSEIPIK